jgi:hypothetical protein
MAQARKAPAPLIRGDLRRRKIAELTERILVHGQRPLEAGAALGLTRRQTYGMMESDDYERHRVEILERIDVDRARAIEEVADRLHAMARKAVWRTEDIMMNSRDDAVALRAANSVLDRVGARVPARIEQRTDIVLSPESVAALQAVARGEDLSPPKVDFTQGPWAKVLEKPAGRLKTEQELFEELDRETDHGTQRLLKPPGVQASPMVMPERRAALPPTGSQAGGVIAEPEGLRGSRMRPSPDDDEPESVSGWQRGAWPPHVRPGTTRDTKRRF